MCIFSEAVRGVSRTRIFARHGEGGRQILVYAMNVVLDRELAMVLPLPVTPGSGDDAVSFIDLSRYARFFDDLARAFPAQVSFGAGRGRGRGGAPLAVHDVGAFVASYVPGPADLDRLDPRFRVPRAVFANQAYDDWGFAVFQLKPHVEGDGGSGGHASQDVHPMALAFPTRRPRALYFPTLHVHDGASVPETAKYDHTLYCQSDDEVMTRTFGWDGSLRPLGAYMRAGDAAGTVALDKVGYQCELDGDLPNADQWLEAPRCRGPQVLSGRGTGFAFELAARAAYTPLPAGGDTAIERARRDTALTRLDDLHAGLIAGLTELTAARAAAWGLGPLTEDATALRLRDDGPWHVTSAGAILIKAGAPGPFAIAFTASSERVEPQVIQLGFAAAPSLPQIAEIQDELGAVLDRAVAAR